MGSLARCCLLLSVAFHAIMSSAEGTVSSAVAAASHFNEFHDWLRANGVKGATAPRQRLTLLDLTTKETWDSDQLEYNVRELETEGGRGVFASSNVKPGEVLLTIPVAAMLGLDASGGPLPFADASEEAALAALLLREMAKGEESRFSPYLKMLPKHVPVPWLTLSPEEYKELQFRDAVELAESYRGEVEEWKQLMDPAMTGNATAAEIEWASAIVMSRVFWLPVKRGKGRMNITEMLEDGKEYPPTRAVLMPFGDMFNYHPFINHVTWDERVFANRIELVAREYIGQGTPVYEPHTGRSVVEVLMEMGVLSEGELFDSIQLFSSLEEAVEWYDRTFDACLDKAPKEVKRCRRELLGRAQATLDVVISDDDELAESVGNSADEEGRYQFALTVGACLDDGLAKVFAVFWSITARQGRSLEPLSYAGLEGPMGHARGHALAAVMRRSAEVLREFPTSEQEDADLLSEVRSGRKAMDLEDDGIHGRNKNEGTSGGMELAIRFRSGVKRRLSTLIEDVVGLLEGSPGFAERLLEHEAERTPLL